MHQATQPRAPLCDRAIHQRERQHDDDMGEHETEGEPDLGDKTEEGTTKHDVRNNQRRLSRHRFGASQRAAPGAGIFREVCGGDGPIEM
jgi:hypothetical protein